MKKIFCKSLSFIIVCASVLSSVSCTSLSGTEPLQTSGTYFDTVISIQVWDGSQDMLDHCLELCEKYENMFSPSIEESDVSRINESKGSPVEVNSETASLIQTGLRYGELSDGRFDITVASAVNLWNFRDNTQKLIPDAGTLADAVSHIDYRCVKVEGNTVTLTDPEARIDLGGIAKGYIADRLKEYLTDSGVEHALINLGGNTLAVGNRYDGSDFRIGIQKPFADTGTILAVLSVDDLSVVSSGNYERYFEKDQVIYHHILDPDTGYPVQNNLFQVTVISECSVDGDALSTACYALGLDRGMELIQSLDGVEAVFITDDYQIHRSDSQISLEITD